METENGYHRTYHAHKPPSIPACHRLRRRRGATIAALDPVFAAIERHKALEIEYCAASQLTDKVAARREGREVAADDKAALDRASEASSVALEEFLDTIPQTKAGCRAAIAYCAKIEWSGEYAAPFMATLLKSPVLAG